MESSSRERKRPRSDGSIASGSERKPDRSRRKPQQKKKNTSKSSSNPSTSEPTATPEGSQMAQALSTFTRIERGRFEAYRRCVFRGDVVSKFIARCLIVEEQRRYAMREEARRLLGGTSHGLATNLTHAPSHLLRQQPPLLPNNNNNNGIIPPLSHLVAPETSTPITIIVSTLAKSYAQRLVTAARRVATSRGYSTDKKLLPEHFKVANEWRRMVGIDPGFFVGRNTTGSSGGGGGGGGRGVVIGKEACAACGVGDEWEDRWEGAKAAQDA